MGSFSTYGMTGIGIAAAIGFVFALTVLNSTNPLDTSGTDDPELKQRQAEIQPSAPSSFFLEQQEPITDGQSGPDSSVQLTKQEDAPAEADSAQQEMALLQEEAGRLKPILFSLTAINGSSGEVIGEVEPGSEFAIGKPVFIQAHFINPNDTELPDHTLILSLTRNGTLDSLQPANGAEFEQAANFRGDIGADGNVKLELYWNPDRAGEYNLLVLSATPADWSKTDAIEPILSLTIKAK
jgi:hypothetical protein